MTTATARMIPEKPEDGGGARSTVSLWAGVLGIPVLWLIQLQTIYALVIWVCPTGRYWVLHALSSFFLIVTIVLGVLSWREWRDSGRGSPDTTEWGVAARNRLLGVIGMCNSVLYGLLIIAAGIATFFIDACWN